MKQIPATMPILVLLILPLIRDARAQCVDPPVIHWVGTNIGRRGPEGVGGGQRDQVHLDIDGNAYLAGGYWDEDGPPVDLDPTDGLDLHFDSGQGPYTTDIFATKVHPDGYMVWTQTAGDEQKEGAVGATIDSQGDFIYAGYFHTLREPPYRVDFDPTPGVDVHVLHGLSEDAFVTKLRADGSYGWTRTFGTPRDARTRAWGVAVTAVDSDIVTGRFGDNVDFDPGRGEDFRTAVGFEDAYLLKLDLRGRYVWVKTFGGPEAIARGYQPAVDQHGNLLIIGSFSMTVDFDPSEGVDKRTARPDNRDTFATLLRADGSYGWTRTLGISSTHCGIAFAGSGRILVSGMFEGVVDFDPTEGVDERASKGDHDVFVSLWTVDGEYLSTRTIGGRGNDIGRGILDSGGGILLSGGFQGLVDFDPSGGEDRRRAQGNTDAFLSRWSAHGEYEWTITFGGEGDARTYVVHGAVYRGGNIWLAGEFTDTVDFDPNEGIEERTALGDRDNFLLKLTCDGGGKCDALISHKAKGKKGKVKSKLRTTLTGGKATVACTGDPGQGEGTGKIKATGKARVAVKRLPKGDYTCTVTRLKDPQGNTVCKGEFLPKDVKVK